MTFLAGSIHIAMMDMIAAATLTAYLWFIRRRNRSVVSAMAVLVIIGIVSILFGAVQLLPTFEYSPLAYRWVGDESPIRSFQRIPYSVLGATAFGPQSIFAFLLGELDAGPSDMTTYFGVLPLILVIIGVWKYWTRPLIRYLAALAVLAWVYTWGASSFLHGILYLVPNLEVAREADRFIYLTNFAMALLAGFGVEFRFRGSSTRAGSAISRLLSILKWVTISFAAFLVLASFHFPVSVTEKTYLSFFFYASAYALLLFVERARKLEGAQFVLIFLIAWDIYSFNWMIKAKSETQKANADALLHLVYDRQLSDFIKAQPGMARVHFDMEDSPNIGNAYGVPVTWAMSATMLVDYTAGYGFERQRDLLGVRYTVRPKTVKFDATPVYNDDRWNVFQNPNALPRAWIVHRAELDASKGRPLKQVIDPTFDLRNIAVVDRQLPTPLNGAFSQTDSVRWLSYEPNRIELEAITDLPGLLVLGEVFYPGWSARVDGSPAPIYRADGVVRAVPLSKGTHRVSMRYEPASVRWGAILSIVTFLGIGLAAIISGRSN